MAPNTSSPGCTMAVQDCKACSAPTVPGLSCILPPWRCSSISTIPAANTGCRQQGPPGSTFHLSYPTAGPGHANLEADLLPCTFFFSFFFLSPSIFLRLLDSVFYNEVTCMANSINASQTGPVWNAPPGYTWTFHLRSRGCEWPSPRAP